MLQTSAISNIFLNMYQLR